MVIFSYMIEQLVESNDEGKDDDAFLLYQFNKKRITKNWQNGTFFNDCGGMDLTNYNITYASSKMQYTWFTKDMAQKDPKAQCLMNSKAYAQQDMNAAKIIDVKLNHFYELLQTRDMKAEKSTILSHPLWLDWYKTEALNTESMKKLAIEQKKWKKFMARLEPTLLSKKAVA